MRLSGKVAIITGGGGGIGEATCMKFAMEGATVVAADLNVQNVHRVVANIKQIGGEALGLAVNVSDAESVATMVDDTIKAFGRLDIIVNNAGITDDSQLLKMSEAQWDKVIDVNLKGVFLCGQAAAKVMATQPTGGVILSASSVVGLYGNFGQTNYAATKWGVIGMTKTWARELGPKKIRAVAVAPGFIVTPMTDKIPEKIIEKMKANTPLKLLGKPEDIANAYAFLASDEASYITGTVLSVDGGIIP
jgi:3-oxoacyl-[acyl-carrier protein] reductase